MKIKFIVPLSTASGNYGKDEIVDIDDRRATNYINAGWAESVYVSKADSVQTAESKIVTEKAVKGKRR